MARHLYLQIVLFTQLSLLLLFGSVEATEFPLALTDARGLQATFSSAPQRVVSLCPSATEIIIACGQSEVLVGVTREDLDHQPQLRLPDLGSYFHPNLEKIAGLEPDLIIASPGQVDVIKAFSGSPQKILVLDARSIEAGFTRIELIGKLFDCEQEAASIVARNRHQLQLVEERLKVVPMAERKRVGRIVVGKRPSIPGDDSFQNQLISIAGGLPFYSKQKGDFVPVALSQWQQFDPQFVYGCHANAEAVRTVLKEPGWSDVTAVHDGAVSMFPCSLTCRAGVHMGDFTQWLAALLYPQQMADPALAVSADEVLKERPLSLDLSYVKQARVVDQRVNDSVYRSLDVHFTAPQRILSTFEGLREKVDGVGNTYIPMGASLGHMAFGPEPGKTAIAENLGYASKSFASMMTGADMNNLANKTEVYQDLAVTVLATAGVRGNAMRMSRDSGLYFSHGTINILVMTNRRLSENAMARAIITATEAKSAALLDLDIRSSYSGLDHRATGTGTDNVMIVQGDGPVANYSGGHTKLGELIAKAVHGAVTEAIYRQNGLQAKRPVRQRLLERGLRIKQVAAAFPDLDQVTATQTLTTLLKDSYYASFVETALAISDDLNKGLISSDVIFNQLCIHVAARISGQANITINDLPRSKKLTPVLSQAFGALLYSAAEKE